MTELLNECGHWWVDEWRQSQEHCTLGIDPCYGRGRCPSFVTCDKFWAIKLSKEDSDKAKLWLVKDIPYEDVEEFVQKWFAEHDEINISCEKNKT